MPHTLLMTISPVSTALILDLDRDVACEFQAVYFLIFARAGFITEPVETITEADMVNPDYISPEDLDAYHEDMREYFESGAYAEDLDAAMREDYWN